MQPNLAPKRFACQLVNFKMSESWSHYNVQWVTMEQLNVVFCSHEIFRKQMLGKESELANNRRNVYVIIFHSHWKCIFLCWLVQYMKKSTQLTQGFLLLPPTLVLFFVLLVWDFMEVEYSSTCHTHTCLYWTCSCWTWWQKTVSSLSALTHANQEQ